MSRRWTETKVCSNVTSYYRHHYFSTLNHVCRKHKSNKRKNLETVAGQFPAWLAIAAIIAALPCAIALKAPDIIPSEETKLIEAGQQLQLTCHGDGPLVWNSEFYSDPRVNITNAKEDAWPRPYTSTLTLSNISHTDAGYFTCRYEDKAPGNSEDETTEDFVQVYVKDKNNLLIRPNSTAVHTFVGGDVLLLCRTSWPDVHIQILNDSNMFEPILLNETSQRYDYSILQGLKIRHVQSSDYGTYTCNATYQDKTEILSFTIVTFDAPTQTTIIYSPSISITNGGSIGVGEDFVVRCYTEQMPSVYYKLDLEVPPSIKKDDARVKRVDGRPPDAVHGKNAWFTELHVKHARKEDAGNYTCVVNPAGPSGNKSRFRSKTLNIFDEGEAFLDVYAQAENISAKMDEIAVWVINITSFPVTFDYTWHDSNGQQVKIGTGKYKIVRTSRDGEFTLEIHGVSIQDMGYHRFFVHIPGTNAVEQKVLNLYLTVKASPTVLIEPVGPQVNCKAESKCELTCTVKANPPPDIQWTFQACNSSTSCAPPVPVNETRRQSIDHTFKSVVEFNPTHHGRYTCFAKNYLNKSSDTRDIRVVDSDFPGHKPIAIIIQPDQVVEGDDVQLICALSKLDNGNKTISWFQIFGDSTRLIENEDIKTEESQWSWRKILEIKNIQQSATGTYKCSTGGRDPIEIFEHMEVQNVQQPTFLESTNLNNSKVDLKLGDSMDLICNVAGRPKPTIAWTWDDHQTWEWPTDLKYKLSKENTVLTLRYVPKDAQGRFKCTAQNRNGTVSAYLDISVTGTRIFSTIALIVIGALFILIVFFGAILARYQYKRGEMRRFLQEIKLNEFYEGAVESINTDLTVTDQAYLLPFDSRWEVPKDRLKLGIQLGSGAFGRVVKAEAIGILDNEPTSTVAVKMVKPNADESHFKALMSELKIMVHLGKHINVVNLLGACTKNLAKKKELFVIVEYCKYGSLLSYMHRNKRTFINQLDPARGTIDPNIDQPINRNSEQSQAARIHYAQLTFTDTGISRKPASNGYRTLEEFKEPNNQGDPQSPVIQGLEGIGLEHDGGYLTPNRRSTEHYVPDSQVESACTGVSYLSNGPTTDGTSKRRSSFGSQWQEDNYRGDYQARDVQPIRTTDLLCWAFQISRGMEYLAARKVLHGDLAARNVLLAENNVVKICDFGLAKEMYKDYKYKKKSEGVLLPVKWMAIESVYYGLFSTQSDCWSFGVVLWELFTLGKTPYPGMEADERFYKRISEGYRMEKPPLAPSCVYDIMLECWAQEPTERPSFSALVDRIGDMISEGLRNHYVDLNADYMRINQTYIAGPTDYLLKMGCVDFSADSTRPAPERKYQNVPDSSDYLEPIRLSSPGPLSPPPMSPQYQNVEASGREPTVVAINSGYQFFKPPNGDGSHQQFQPPSPPPPQNPEELPLTTLQINYSPDIKDLYGLREDSTSPDRNSIIDDNHVNIVMGTDGIRGVDNMNYVPNPTLFNKMQKLSSPTEPNKLTNGTGTTTTTENGRRQKRQKNDSGLGSIDSSHFDHQRYNSPEGQHHQHQYTELGHLQDSNGYVTHQNITSLS